MAFCDDTDYDEVQPVERINAAKAYALTLEEVEKVKRGQPERNQKLLNEIYTKIHQAIKSRKTGTFIEFHAGEDRYDAKYIIEYLEQDGYEVTVKTKSSHYNLNIYWDPQEEE